MARSLKKGPFIDGHLMKKENIQKMKKDLKNIYAVKVKKGINPMKMRLEEKLL